MSKVILFDVGNTNIVMACYEDGVMLFTERMITYGDWNSEIITDRIITVLRSNSISWDTIEGAIISTVVPSVVPLLKEAMYKLCGIRTFVADIGNIGVKIRGYDVSCLGTDRLMDLLAASNKYGASCIVCDLGTCTTFSVMDEDQAFIGGMICAGIQISLDSESERTAQLPQLRAAVPEKLIGTDTATCMLSGEVIGTAAMIDGLYERICEEVSASKVSNCRRPLVITGGLGALIMPWLKNEAYYEPNLQLDGLEILYQNLKQAEQE